MKKYLFMPFNSINVIRALFICCFMLSALSGYAQRDRHEKIEKLKFEFISKQLNLSPKTAEDFWPVYNEYDNAKQMLFRKYRNKYREENLSMDDVEFRMEREKEFMELREKYINRFAKILSPVQLTDLKRAETQFKKVLLNRVNQGR